MYISDGPSDIDIYSTSEFVNNCSLDDDNLSVNVTCVVNTTDITRAPMMQVYVDNSVHSGGLAKIGPDGYEFTKQIEISSDSNVTCTTQKLHDDSQAVTKSMFIHVNSQ